MIRATKYKFLKVIILAVILLLVTYMYLLIRLLFTSKVELTGTNLLRILPAFFLIFILYQLIRIKNCVYVDFKEGNFCISQMLFFIATGNNKTPGIHYSIKRSIETVLTKDILNIEETTSSITEKDGRKLYNPLRIIMLDNSIKYIDTRFYTKNEIDKIISYI